MQIDVGGIHTRVFFRPQTNAEQQPFPGDTIQFIDRAAAFRKRDVFQDVATGDQIEFFTREIEIQNIPDPQAGPNFLGSLVNRNFRLVHPKGGNAQTTKAPDQVAGAATGIQGIDGQEIIFK